MTAQKAVPAAASTSTPTQKAVPTTAPSNGRKPWVKKTPVEVFLEQIKRQEERVAQMRTALTREERELAKLQQARKVLEAQ